VIVVTATAAEVRDPCRAAGYSGYVHAPFDFADLRTQLEEVLPQ